MIEAIRQGAREPQAHRYMDPRGTRELRSAICDSYEERFGVRLDPDSKAAAVGGV